MVQAVRNFDVNLNNCDKEPIHLLGRIQSHGYLLAFSRENLNLSYYSENISNLSGFDQIIKGDTNFRDIFDDTLYSELKEFISSPNNSFFVRHAVNIYEEKYAIFFSESKSDVIIELEVYDEHQTDLVHKELKFLENFQSESEVANTLSKLAATAAINLRSFTGFDRVMIYQFDEDGAGEVIAEDKKQGLESFLGLKYPASDIPKQARELYKINLIRSIHDVDDIGVKINSLVDSNDILDLSISIYRSVSPIHIEYLKNMGVSATHAISLLIDGELWGMIICHHYSSPFYLKFARRHLSLLFGKSVARSIDAISLHKEKLLFDQRNNILNELRRAHIGTAISKVLNLNSKEVFKTLNAQGLTLLDGNNTLNKGEVLDKPAINEICDYLIDNGLRTWSSYQLSADLTIQNDLKEIAGLIIVLINEAPLQCLLLFRKEQNKVINWAGNPEKPVVLNEEDGFESLSPRRSFALWQETVGGKSEPWTHEDIAFCESVREIFLTREILLSLTKPESKKGPLQPLDNLLLSRNNELSIQNKSLRIALQDREKLNSELALAKRAANEVSKLKTGFLSNISHEMRTPINGIIGLSELISMDNNISNDSNRYTNLIKESSYRLVNTVNRILEMTKLEANKIDYHFATHDLGELIEMIIEPIKPLASKRNQNLTYINHNKGSQIVTDEHILRQIITNLVSNAIKYTQVDGEIQINTKIYVEKGEQKLNIIVEDNGPGIDKENIEKIFEPFFMVAEVSRAQDSSSGLGLYLVRNYVKYLNGEIKVNSVNGMGTEFQVKIPLHT